MEKKIKKLLVQGKSELLSESDMRLIYGGYQIDCKNSLLCDQNDSGSRISVCGCPKNLEDATRECANQNKTHVYYPSCS